MTENNIYFYGGNKKLMEDDYDIIKILGSGEQGIVFLVVYQNNNYAFKLSFSRDKSEVKTFLDNEIVFQDTIAKKFPDQFVILRDYSVSDNKCVYHSKIRNIINNINDYKKKNKLLSISSYGFCAKRLYDLIDGTLGDIISQLNEKQIYSSLIQLAYCIHILEINDYSHGDETNPQNIGYLNTNREFINIKKFDIPTFGRIFKLIDYERTQKKEFMAKKHHFLNEFMYIFGFIFLRSTMDYKLYTFANNKVGWRKYLDFENKAILEDPKFFDFFEKLDIPSTIALNAYIYLFPNRFAKIVLNDINEYKKYKKIYGKNHASYSTTKFTYKEIKKICKYKNKIKKMIKFFLNKINS
jgi:hypothetical protein